MSLTLLAFFVTPLICSLISSLILFADTCSFARSFFLRILFCWLAYSFGSTSFFARIFLMPILFLRCSLIPLVDASFLLPFSLCRYCFLCSFIPSARDQRCCFPSAPQLKSLPLISKSHVHITKSFNQLSTDLELRILISLVLLTSCLSKDNRQ